ncbi:MAG: NYN domain-containing protein [Deltaproteobacteria bacterium]|nr:NYN domain-containing protein [Deltaproteobacteria bacterium]
MTFIIDGNNLIGRKITADPKWRSVKENLVLKIVKYVAATRKKVKIVFDGIEEANYPDGTVFKGVQIFYAKPGKTADERIKNMIRNISYARDVTVVSSDRELKSFVSSKGAKVISREVFRSELAKLNLREEKEIKESNPKIENVSEWLEFFGMKREQQVTRKDLHKK